MKERVLWIDVAKGIGILLVMVGHTRLCGTCVGHWLTQFHLPLFFVLAGLGFDESRYPRYADYVKRKIVALGYPYLMLSLAVAGLFAFFNFDASFSFASLLTETCKGQSYGTLWFVSSLFFVELAFAGLARCVQGRLPRIVACLLMAGVGFRLSLESDSWIWWEVPTILYSTVFYCAGWLLRPLLLREVRLRTVVPVALLLGAGSGLTAWVSPHVYALARLVLVNPFWFAFIALIGSGFVMAASMGIVRWSPGTRVLAWFGRNSVIFLALHVACGMCRSSWGISGIVGYALEYILLFCLAGVFAGPLNGMVVFRKAGRR